MIDCYTLKLMKIPISVPDKHIRPLTVHGMTGRMVHIPNHDSKKVIIYIHGLHTSAERHYSLCEFLSDYGTVYAPDMPGFGGMDSFYKVGMKPSYDNFADYIYTVIQSLRLKHDQSLTLVGLSFGSQVMTRLLQKHPELATKNFQAISLAGYGSGKDFKPLIAYRAMVYPLVFFASRKYISRLVRFIFFNPVVLSAALGLFIYTKPKLKNDKVNKPADLFRMEYYLWRIDNTRTHARTISMTFRDDLRKYSNKKINNKLHNVFVQEDQYFDMQKVEATLNGLYKSVDMISLSMGSHAPSLVADKESIAVMFPEKTRKLLAS